MNTYINFKSVSKIATFLAVAFVLLSPFTASAWADPKIKEFDQRCVGEQGVVEVELYSVTNATLTYTDTGNIIDEWEVDDRSTSDKNTVFLTYSSLDDGEYTLDIVNYDGDTSSKTFTVDCDVPEPELDLVQECKNEDGAITVTAPNGLDSWELFNTDVDPNTPTESGANVAAGDTITVSGLADENYRFEGTLGNKFETLAFSFDCDEDEKEPNLDLVKQCNAQTNKGDIEVTAPNGLDSYELFNADTNASVESGTNVAAGSVIEIDGLENANYRFEATLGSRFETLAFAIDCDKEEPDDLTGVCEVSPNRVETGESVTFSSDASGGTSPYSFSWDLENSNDDDNTQNVTTSYSTEGTFDGTVTITDDAGDQITRTCSVRVEDDGGGGGGGGGGPKLPPRDDDPDVRGDRDVNFGVQCLPDRSTRLVGEVVTYEATIDSDDIDEDDVDFDWSGQSGTDEDGDTATIQYRTTGIKEIQVEAEYDGETETDTCFVQIGRGEGVTLDQVPYTGPGDTAKTIGFIAALLLMALAGGYAIIRRREEDGVPVGIPTNRE